jgi:ABC-2 type transport system permease protein
MTTMIVAVDRPAAPSVRTLALVELRKMTDTRAGRWLLALVALVGVVLVGVVLFAAPRQERAMPELYSASLTGVALLLPIVGVLSVTSEWSQRTALTTFVLVPRRHRVVAAKMVAASLLAAVCVTAAALITWAGRAVGAALDRTDAGWGIPPQLLATTLLFAVLNVLGGVAFGLVFLNSPLAIVMSFLLPIAWSILGETVSALGRTAQWLDTARTTAPFVEPGAEITARAWAQLGTSQVVWLLLPLLIGFVRVTRKEVK